jgi:hypothetical protein
MRMTLEPTFHEQRPRSGHVVGTDDDAGQVLGGARHLRLEPQDLPIGRPAGCSPSPVQVAEDADCGHAAMDRILDPFVELAGAAVG